MIIQDDFTKIRVGAGEVHCTIHIGREEAKQDILSLFAPPPQSQLGNWDRLVSAGEIHCRSIDWEEAK